MSGNYQWTTVGVTSDGEVRSTATHDEAEAVRLFWEIADTWEPTEKHDPHVAFYGESRKLWLDEHTWVAETVVANLMRATPRRQHRASQGRRGGRFVR